MLQISNLSKSYEKINAVDDISFIVDKGEIFGFLGPNGAGKTTTISMISGLLKPDSGKITIDDMDLSIHSKAIKKIMGVVPQDMAFYEELSAKENLKFWGKLHGVPKKILESRITEYLVKTGLQSRENDPLKKYSGGMKRRINLILGLLHHPKLLLLDEPSTGIDVQTKLNIFDIIRESAARGTAVLFTTHNLQEAQDLCHRIAIIDQGRILAAGTLSELIKIVGEKDIVVLSGSFSVSQGQDLIGSMPEISLISIQEGKLVLSLEASQNIPLLLEKFFNAGIKIEDVSIKQPNLESVFLKLTGKELRE